MISSLRTIMQLEDSLNGTTSEFKMSERTRHIVLTSLTL